MIMEVTQVSPYSSSSQDSPRQQVYIRRNRKAPISFGSMLAEEEEKLEATMPLPVADEFRSPEKAAVPESHYALTEQELEESLAKLLRYAGLDGLE